MKLRMIVLLLLAVIPCAAADDVGAKLLKGPWGLERFLPLSRIWDGFKPGSKTYERMGLCAMWEGFGLGSSVQYIYVDRTKMAKYEREIKLSKIAQHEFTFTLREQSEKPRKKTESKEWKAVGRRVAGSWSYKKIGTTEHDLAGKKVKATVVRATQKSVLPGEEAAEWRVVVNEKLGLLDARGESKGTKGIRWQLRRVNVKKQLGRVKLSCREYDYTNNALQERLLLCERVPGYVVMRSDPRWPRSPVRLTGFKKFKKR